MIRISNLSLPVDGDLEQLRKRAARALGLRPGQLGELEIVRQSIDARNRSEVHYVYTVEMSMPQEERLVENAPGRNVSRTERQAYAFPAAGRRSALPPVVVGMGPAGLFAALFLARNGFPCVVLERGQDVDQRTRDVDRFWTAGALDEGSNVQFGEGGAGTFSDGKLTTGTHDPRIAAVLDTLVEAGAPADVKYSHKPHVGTDVLRQVVKHIRQELIALGCDVRFGHRLEGLTIQGDALTGLRVAGPQGGYLLKADTLVLAPGHSARDTFAMLHQAGVPMEQKPFAVGVRIEHLLQFLGVVVNGEAELLNFALGLLLGAELPQTVLLETGREALPQVVQQIVVEVIDAALLKGDVEHGPSLLGVLGKPSRQLRGDGKRLTRIALHQRLLERPLRLAAMVATGGVKVGEATFHEDVNQLAALVDVDGRRIIRIGQRQPHESEPERRQLLCSLHSAPLFLCARAKLRCFYRSRNADRSCRKRSIAH